MAKLLVMYNRPADPAAFDAYYTSTHTPLAKKLPELRAFTVSDGQINTPEGQAPYHRIAELTFGSMADLQAAVASPEGEAAVADFANFAGAGVTVVMYDTQEA
jgi:uncharacterized protein (TIGR02118 family)